MSCREGREPASPGCVCPPCAGCGHDCPPCAGLPADFDLAAADLGDVVVALLVGTLAGLRDRLYKDGFEPAASLVQDLVEVADDYVSRRPP